MVIPHHHSLETDMKRILIVEDDVNLSQVIGFRFQDAGFETKVSNDSTSAVSLHKKHKFDIIITDIQMPYISGEKLVRQLRSLDRKTPIFVFTGTEANLEEIRSWGAIDIFYKTVQFNSIIDRVVDVLGSPK